MYQILKEIGHGGMGEVYRAARVDGIYEKEVAIKFVRGGFDTASVIERFRNERQILASLDHPNIARLLDGGTTDDGVPYLVMELIEGTPIDEYSDQRSLAITSRLELFRQVCGAVQYAHQHLVIHRDIKPGNILVGDDGIPKLLDFGIAKILDPAAGAEPTQFRPMTLSTQVRNRCAAYRLRPPQTSIPSELCSTNCSLDGRLMSSRRETRMSSHKLSANATLRSRVQESLRVSQYRNA